LLDQIPADVPIETIGGDGAYDTKPCHAQIDARGAAPSIPPREGAMPWPDSTPGAAWRNAAIDAIGKSSRRERDPDVPLKVLTGPCLWARKIGSQATEVSIRVGVLNRMAALACPQSVRIA
ncbi:transposase, partial [Ralstonia solanacearum]